MMPFLRFLWILCMGFGMIGAFGPKAHAEEALYKAEHKRDPFVPLVTSTTVQAPGLLGVESAEEITVEGIVYDPPRSLVVANGTVLKEGEEVGGVKVLEIKPEGATFAVNGFASFKSLYQEEKKTKKA